MDNEERYPPDMALARVPQSKYGRYTPQDDLLERFLNTLREQAAEAVQCEEHLVLLVFGHGDINHGVSVSTNLTQRDAIRLAVQQNKISRRADTEKILAVLSGLGKPESDRLTETYLPRGRNLKTSQRIAIPYNLRLLQHYDSGAAFYSDKSRLEHTQRATSACR